MELAKVVLITKDERDLIDDFLTFYGELFGYRNVVVVDNGSTDPAVMATYERFQAMGVEVRVDRTPFPRAAQFMSMHMNSIRHTCRWILPLETDEFMFVIPKANDAAYATHKRDIVEYLESIPDDVSVVRYGAFLGSAVDPSDAAYVDGQYERPPRDMLRFYNQGWDKVIVRASTFTRMTQWCHHADFTTGRKVVGGFLGLLHYHETGFRRQVESAVRVMDSFGYVDRTQPLAAQLARTRELYQMGVACGHKVEYYEKWLRRSIVLRNFQEKLGRLPSVEEMEQRVQDPEAAIEASTLTPPASLTPQSSTPPGHLQDGRDALLYCEPRRQHEFEIAHVANFFAALETKKAALETKEAALETK